VRVRASTMLAISVIAAGSGCDRGSTTSAPAPATQPAQVVSNTSISPATTQVVPSYIWLEDRRLEFPPAKVILRSKDDRLIALLFSDDPPNAIDDNYTGNSFYLELNDLECPEAGKLTGALWSFKAPNSERAESVNGIFLQGRRTHLQPFDVRIQFEGADSPVIVRLAGTFLQFDSEAPQTPGKLVAVRAELPADVKAKGQK
jgi:hypothetical protein